MHARIISVYLYQDQEAALKSLAAQQQTSMSRLGRLAVQELLDRAAQQQQQNRSDHVASSSHK